MNALTVPLVAGTEHLVPSPALKSAGLSLFIRIIILWGQGK